MSTPILLIGIGNQYRCDDGVGLAVTQAVKAKNLPNIQIIENNGDGMALIETWRTATKVLLVDAVSSGAKPGTIYRFDAHTQPIPTSLSFQSTHAFGVAEAMNLANALDQFPSCLIVFGIEGKNFTAGIGLSPEVENAVQEVVEQITHEIYVYSL